MVLDMSQLCTAYLNLPEVASAMESVMLAQTLKKASSVIKTVASKLYIQRFGKPAKDVPDATIYCCVCNEDILFI